MKKSFCFLLVATLTQTAAASIVSTWDAQNNCQIYRATSADLPQQTGEIMVDNRNFYGFTLKNLAINFDQKTAQMDVIKRIFFGFDRSLLEGPVTIHASNPDFQKTINRLNNSISVLNQVCVTQQNELIWTEKAGKN